MLLPQKCLRFLQWEVNRHFSWWLPYFFLISFECFRYVMAFKCCVDLLSRNCKGFTPLSMRTQSLMCVGGGSFWILWENIHCNKAWFQISVPFKISKLLVTVLLLNRTEEPLKPYCLLKTTLAVLECLESLCNLDKQVCGLWKAF